MICALNGYFFRVEERAIGDNNNLSNHDDLVSSVSNRSIADYVCYSIYGHVRPVIVIIETKTKFTWNGVAQLLGYYYRAATDHRKPGVAVLLTKEKLHVVSFPFHTDEGSLANAICFEGIHLSQDNDVTFSLYILAIITSVCYNSNPVKLPLEDKFLSIRKSFEFQIQTNQDRRLDDLEKRVIKLQKELNEKDRELAELKCRFVPLELSLPRQVQLLPKHD